MKNVYRLVIIIAVCGLLGNTGVKAAPADMSPTKSEMIDSPVKESLINTKESETKDQNVSVDYALPYPGILTDHPLYFLKILRDNIMEMLIVDPVKKIEFNILQSDKFFSMSTMFIDAGKWTNANDTLNKSVNQSDKAITGITTINSGVSKVPVFVIEKLEKSLLKHKEILVEVARSRSGKERDTVESVLVTLEKQTGQVRKFIEN